MVAIMDKLEIIRQKQSGKSNREVARVTGYDRDTVSKYWNEYQRQETRLREDGADVPEILEQMFDVCGAEISNTGAQEAEIY
jgi:hypothetical protein